MQKSCLSRCIFTEKNVYIYVSVCVCIYGYRASSADFCEVCVKSHLDSALRPPPHLASTTICHANLFSITCYQRFASDYANVSNVRLTPTHSLPTLTLTHTHSLTRTEVVGVAFCCLTSGLLLLAVVVVE